MTAFLRTLLLVMLAIWSTVTGGCCKRVETNPARPASVRGWQEFEKEWGIKGRGEFILEKGQSVDDGTVGVQLIDTISARECRGTDSSRPRAILRLFRVNDKQTLLEMSFTVGNTGLINFNPSLANEYGFGTLAIGEINTKDNWIWFELWS